MRFAYAMAFATFICGPAITSRADSLAPKYRIVERFDARSNPFPTYRPVTGVMRDDGISDYAIPRGDYVMDVIPSTVGAAQYLMYKGGSSENLIPEAIGKSIRYLDYDSSGRILGYDRFDPNQLPYLYDTNSGEKNWLKGPAGSNDFFAWGMNEAGVIVGNSLVWQSADAEPFNILSRIENTGAWYGLKLFDISDDGRMAGRGYYQGGSFEMVFELLPVWPEILTDEPIIDTSIDPVPGGDPSTAQPEPVPVPEPSTWIVLTAGLGVFMRSLRKARKQA